VSGTNIKTINNTSILGSGNIDIGGGTGGNLIVSETIGDNAIEFADEQGHIVMLVDNQGTLKTKTFNSSSTSDTPGQLTDMVYELHRRTAANTEFPVFSIKGNVLVIGDSTVAGTNVGTKISALMSIASGYTLTDISQGGDTIQGQTSKYNNLGSSVKAAINYAVIQIGLNDVYPASATLSDLKTKYQTLINAIKTNSPNAYIVISCMLPCRARWQALVPTTADHAQQMWAELNQSIIDNEYGANAVASIHQWALAYDHFTLRPEYNTGDKIHENKAGQQVILLSWLSAMFNNNNGNKGGNS
jgi:lysophospholipase L1-like esterase